MRLFKRGARQATPVAKNVSVTELLMRGDAARAPADSIPPVGPAIKPQEVAESKSAAKGHTAALDA